MAPLASSLLLLLQHFIFRTQLLNIIVRNLHYPIARHLINIRDDGKSNGNTPKAKTTRRIHCDSTLNCPLLLATGMKSSTIDKISIFLAELLGTGLLVFLGCMGE